MIIFLPNTMSFGAPMGSNQGFDLFSMLGVGTQDPSSLLASEQINLEMLSALNSDVKADFQALLTQHQSGDQGFFDATTKVMSLKDLANSQIKSNPAQNLGDLKISYEQININEPTLMGEAQASQQCFGNNLKPQRSSDLEKHKTDAFLSLNNIVPQAMLSKPLSLLTVNLMNEPRFRELCEFIQKTNVIDDIKKLPELFGKLVEVKDLEDLLKKPFLLTSIGASFVEALTRSLGRGLEGKIEEKMSNLSVTEALNYIPGLSHKESFLHAAESLKNLISSIAPTALVPEKQIQTFDAKNVKEIVNAIVQMASKGEDASFPGASINSFKPENGEILSFEKNPQTIKNSSQVSSKEMLFTPVEESASFLQKDSSSSSDTSGQEFIIKNLEKSFAKDEKKSSKHDDIFLSKVSSLGERKTNNLKPEIHITEASSGAAVSKPSIVKHVIGDVKMLASQGGGSLKMTISQRINEQIEKIEVTLKVKDKEVEIKFSTASENLRKTLEKDLPKLEASLREQDFTTRKIEVQEIRQSSSSQNQFMSKNQGDSGRESPYERYFNLKETLDGLRSFSQTNTSSAGKLNAKDFF